MTVEETKLWFTMLWCDGGRVFMVEEEIVYKHVSTSTLKLVIERDGYVRNMVKVKCTSRVTLNLPYIGAESANGLRKIWHLLRRPLVIAWTVVMELGCTFVRWSAQDFRCSFTVFCLVCLGLWLNVPCFIGLQAGLKQFESSENCSSPFQNYSFS